MAGENRRKHRGLGSVVSPVFAGFRPKKSRQRAADDLAADSYTVTVALASKVGASVPTGRAGCSKTLSGRSICPMARMRQRRPRTDRFLPDLSTNCATSAVRLVGAWAAGGGVSDGRVDRRSGAASFVGGGAPESEIGKKPPVLDPAQRPTARRRAGACGARARARTRRTPPGSSLGCLSAPK